MSRFSALFAVLLPVVQAEDITNWVMSGAGTASNAARGADCEVGAWQDCSACSATCGDGVKLCVRKVIVQRSGSGRPCPPLFEQRPCSAATACAVDCAVSKWAACSECTRSCGGGTQLCRRSIVSHAAHGGRPCPSLLSPQHVCNTQPCSPDCTVSSWSAWSTCGASCGGAQQTRNRVILHDQRLGGKPCPALAQTRACNVEHCPIDCAFTDWGSWSLACTKSCGGGYLPRTRKMRHAAAYGGACPTLPSGGLLVDSSRRCSEKPCPAACQVTAWQCAPCTRSCGAGRVVCTREIAVQPAPGGDACPDLRSEVACNTEPCPVDCVYSDWDCGACSVTCGEGVRHCFRNVTHLPRFGGRSCGAVAQTRPCNAKYCPVDCVVSSWSSWTDCSRSCGRGLKRRSRAVQHFSLSGGRSCPALLETEPCRVRSCYGLDHSCDDEHINWTCGPCSKSCGMGSANCTSPKSGKCPARAEPRPCNWHSCPIDCKMTDWEWEGCDASCGGGRQVGVRRFKSQAFFGGRECADKNLTRVRSCNTAPCAVDCRTSEWLCGPCSASCGGGAKLCQRNVLTVASRGGRACPMLAKTQNCAEQACPVDCGTTPWGAWARCSASCGNGVRRRARAVIMPPRLGGAACPQLVEHMSCGTGLCPVDCRLSSWGACSACSVSCGVGTRRCTRSLVVVARNGGRECSGRLLQDQDCTVGACPGDCKVGDWGHCSPCSKTCGGGTQLCQRSIVKQASFGGKACPSLVAEQTCGEGPCPVDCVVTPWESCSLCTRTCGGGARLCTRTVRNKGAVFGGRACPALAQQRACNTHMCPVDCAVDKWGTWSACDRTCGSGAQLRLRNVTVPQGGGGKACPQLRQTRPCNTRACPIDCEVFPWGPFDSCSASCGGGVTVRSRAIFRMASLGGRSCPSLIDTKPCNTHACKLQTCHADHVKCELLGGLGHTRVHVVHQRTHMPVGGGFHCKKVDPTGGEDPRMFVGCKCVCDKHPPCCSRLNYVLGGSNRLLLGNTFKEVPAVADCCALCTQHPLCESWEYSTQRVCMLKSGTPEFVPLSAQLRSRMTTFAGPRAGHPCATVRVDSQTGMQPQTEAVFREGSPALLAGTPAQQSEAALPSAVVPDVGASTALPVQAINAVTNSATP